MKIFYELKEDYTCMWHIEEKHLKHIHAINLLNHK